MKQVTYKGSIVIPTSSSLEMIQMLWAFLPHLSTKCSWWAIVVSQCPSCGVNNCFKSLLLLHPGLPLSGRTAYITPWDCHRTSKLNFKDVPRTSEISFVRPKSIPETSAGLGGSVGCAVRLETRRSRVQPPPRSATFFRGDWSWNIFYGHSLPSADSRRAVVSFWRKNVHSTG